VVGALTGPANMTHLETLLATYDAAYSRAGETAAAAKEAGYDDAEANHVSYVASDELQVARGIYLKHARRAGLCG